MIRSTRRSFLHGLVAVGGGASLAGCASVSATLTSPASTGTQAGASEIRQAPWLLAATTRAPVGNASKEPWFGTSRHRASYARVEFSPPSSAHFAGMFGDDCSSLGPVVKAGASAVGLIGGGWEIRSVELISPETLGATLDSAMGNREILVYVHGFNQTFAEAAADAAWLSDSIGFRGKTVIFTWPSKGGLFDYNYDRESALWSRDALEHLLAALVAHPGGGRVHLVAHSMGGHLSVEALRQLHIGREAEVMRRLGAIVLASPDIDMDVFKNSLRRMTGIASKMTVITASNDRALKLSSKIAGGVARVGASDAKALEALGVRVVDASQEGCGLLNHSLFLSEKSVRRLVKQAIEAQSGVP